MKKIKEIMIDILVLSMFVILWILALDILGPSLISPIIVQNLAKNPNNIKNGGCLIYVGQWQNRLDMYSLNKQRGEQLSQLTIKEFPFYGKWYNNNFYLNELNSKKCVRVKYIEHKFIWRKKDYIYDIQ